MAIKDLEPQESRTETGAASPLVQWTRIADPSVPLAIEPRTLDRQLSQAAATMMADSPFNIYGEGVLRDAVVQLGILPLSLRQDIMAIGTRFMTLMQVRSVRIRLEGITTNACWKIHADYTDVRLITTYAGPTSQYIPVGAPATEPHLRDVQLGAIALFKGRTYGQGHVPCFHRSPPAADLGAKRLVLVIDTPLRES